jgi:hypothetical protein
LQRIFIGRGGIPAQAGLDAANAGDVISAEEVETEAAAWRAQTRRKMADANS